MEYARKFKAMHRLNDGRKADMEEFPERLPWIVLIIDELGYLPMPADDAYPHTQHQVGNFSEHNWGISASGVTTRERSPEAAQTRLGLTLRVGSGCGLTEASAPGES